MDRRLSLLGRLAADLADENAALDAVLGDLDWALPTPADGWDVRDTVLHLHVTDVMGLAAVHGDDLTAAFREGYRAARDAPDLLTRWQRDRSRLVDELLARPSSAGKLPWVGPPMSPASFLTARLMETWAHGTDIRDAAGVATTFTPRLRHIADLGVRTRGWSYANRGLEIPASDVHVALTTPDGEVWDWGSATAAQQVSGPALDFCLLVVQRRPRSDLALTAAGDDAGAWLEIAQAFAGPPAGGRR